MSGPEPAPARSKNPTHSGEDRGSASPAALLGPDGPLAALLPNYQVRASQQDMAHAIEAALEAGGVHLCEAETGTGKTFAYLVPCLTAGLRTIVSTATRTLQDQLFRRDIPVVDGVLGGRRRIAMLKGRANYLCRYRLERSHGQPDLSAADRGQIAYLYEWATRTRDGDRAGAVEVPEDAWIWPRVTSTVENCLGQECDYFDDCFVVRARREAAAADVVVVNHHLLFADMALRDEGFGEILPSAEVVIMDEAHQVPEIASRFFGRSVSSYQLRELARDCRAAYFDEAADMPQLGAALDALEAATARLQEGAGSQARRLEWASFARAPAGVDDFEQLLARLQALQNLLGPAAERGPTLANCEERSRVLHARLQEVSGSGAVAGAAEEDADRGADWVRWVELAPRYFTFNATPISVAGHLARTISDSPASWVFTSATLSIDGDFSHFRREIGVEIASEGRWPSPFDYQSQSRLLLPSLPCEPGASAYTGAVADLAGRLVSAARGRTLILFTSYRALRETRERLDGRIRYPLLVQGDAPRAELLRQFRDLGDAVLLGTGTFWEGVDVPGPALTCLIIDKLPFATPDEPVVRARIDALRRDGDDPFMSYQLPAAVIALRQGVGRLIRDRSDRGLLVLCDPRLESRRYGRRFLDALPPMPQVHAVEEAEAFLRTL